MKLAIRTSSSVFVVYKSKQGFLTVIQQPECANASSSDCKSSFDSVVRASSVSANSRGESKPERPGTPFR